MGSVEVSPQTLPSQEEFTLGVGAGLIKYLLFWIHLSICIDLGLEVVGLDLEQD